MLNGERVTTMDALRGVGFTEPIRDDEGRVKGMVLLTPRQRVEKLIGHRVEEIGAALDSVIRWGLRSGAGREGRPTDRLLELERRYNEVYETGDPRSGDYASPDLTSEEIEEAQRLWPIIRALEQDAERRVRAEAERRPEVQARAQITSEISRRTDTRAREPGACTTRHQGSRRVTSRSAGGGGPGEPHEDEGEPDALKLWPHHRWGSCTSNLLRILVREGRL